MKKKLSIQTMTALSVVAAILLLIALDLLADRLPDRFSRFDMTNSGIYEISDVSRDYLSGLREAVDITVLDDEASMDRRIVRFLDRYAELSPMLHLSYVDPVGYPAALTKYDCEAGTIIVECAATGRAEKIDTADIIGYDAMTYYYYGTYEETDFDGEGLLTSAVDNVLTGTSKAAYTTTGHGEITMAVKAKDLLRKSHFSVNEVNLLTDGGIPEDCALLILNAPAKDLAVDELQMLRGYLAQGGQVMYAMAGQNVSLTNLEALCLEYGLAVEPGIVADMQWYYQNNYYLIFPSVDPAVDAAAGISSKSLFLFYQARGMTLCEPQRDSITVRSFLNTSDSGRAVVDESQQKSGCFSLGAVAVETLDDGRTSRFTVIGSDALTDADILDNFANVSNAELFLQAATAGMEDVSSFNIPAIDLTEPRNSVTTGGIWGLVLIVVIPVGLLACGFVRWLRRRKM